MPQRPNRTSPSRRTSAPAPALHVAVVGAGIAGIACARTLLQAGHRVTLLEQEAAVGGRMTTLATPFGGFDPGVQYFTVRDPRFRRVLDDTPALVRPWSVSTVRVLDELGHVLASAPPPSEPHYVAKPGMVSLLNHWAEPLDQPERFGGLPARLLLSHKVTRIERDALAPTRWQLRTDDGSDAPQPGQAVLGGFDRVVLALPPLASAGLLAASDLAPRMRQRLTGVSVAPCWTLLLAFPQASQPGMGSFGPHWNAARSTHHRVSWLTRESSKPGRTAVERWTVQASAAWSREHERDDPARANAKLLRAFAEITGIHATPAHAEVRLWRQARTLVPLGRTHLWDDARGIGLCGDWCIGSRVEDAFVSGLALALAMDER